MTGFRFVFAIVRVVVTGVAVPAGEKLSTAVQLIVYVPACTKLGVPVSVMLGFANGPAELEAVKNGALFVCDSVTSWPASASEAEPVTETEAFSEPLAVAGADITGFVFVRPIVSTVVAAAVPAGTFTSEADQLIVNVPVCAALGVPVSVMLGASDGPLELEAVKNGALFVCDRVTF